LWTLTSSAFASGGPIPPRHTGDGADLSPPLAWSEPPHAARELALVVDDPDAPTKEPWVHWVLYNIPPSATGLAEAVKPNELPAGTLDGLNDWKRAGYGGPCPPIGRHRYFHKLYALDNVLPDLNRPTKAQLETAMQGHVLEKFELIGTYQKD